MLRIGAHMSVAGGVSRAVERARMHGCEALQIFSKNASRWHAAPLDRAEIHRFRRLVDETGLAPVVSHGSYLINLATAVPALRELSIAALMDELDRAHALGLLGVVLHPGTCTSGSTDAALRLVAEALRRAFRARPRRRTMVLLEHTAGQGAPSDTGSSISPRSSTTWTARAGSACVWTPAISPLRATTSAAPGGMRTRLRRSIA
jgi:deoxyribonuclease-4